MNVPRHRIAACLGRAALKTHALQTLTRRPLTRPEREAFGVRPIYRRWPSGRRGERFMAALHDF